MKTFVCLLLLLVPSVFCNHNLASKYQFSVALHPNYTLYWNFDNAAENITFAVRVRTTGWVGFGVSPNGQMPQSDVVIGWVDGTGNNFQDRFATGRFTPPVDPVQNWFLISAEEEDGYTTLEFTRNFTTCDDRDRPIKHDTSNVIWSWHDDDPVNGVFQRHTSMGSTSVNLLGGLPNRPQEPAVSTTFNVTVDEITMPSSETTYWCKGVRLPEVLDNQEQFITKYAPYIQPGNEEFLHHLLVFLCDDLSGVDLTQDGPCNSVDRKIRQCRTEMIGAWAIGGDTFYYPENVAYPIGGPDFQRWLVIEIHYNNPRRVGDVVDSSGLRFTMTPTRRQHNAGILFTGHVVSDAQLIPPNAARYSIFASCSSECTRMNLPEGGIHVFANTLHTHLLGVGVELSVLRTRESRTCGGTSRYEEVAIIDRNPSYDFNFQQTSHLPQEVTVMPGDTLLLRCNYTSAGTGRTGVTLGGESTEEEMCLSFPIYYPKIEMTSCVSQSNLDNLRDFVANFVPEQYIGNFSRLGPGVTRQELADTFNLLDWNEAQVQALEEAVYVNSVQTSICSINSMFTTEQLYSPQVCCPLEEVDVCTGTTPTPCCDRECPAIREVGSGVATIVTQTSVLVSLFLIALLVAVM